MFHFSKEKDILRVGERIPFQLKFCSKILGEFQETFRWKLQGSTELMSLDFSGHVMPPSYRFDREEVNFGKVSFSFPKTERVRFTNTSKVPFRF